MSSKLAILSTVCLFISGCNSVKTKPSGVPRQQNADRTRNELFITHAVDSSGESRSDVSIDGVIKSHKNKKNYDFY